MQVFSLPHGGLIKAWVDGVQFEAEAQEQVFRLAAMPFVFRHVALMPDVHWGVGSTIGSVFATQGAVIPAAVGVDIGCVDAETEVLTPTGWISIADWQNQSILVYDAATGIGSFEVPSEYIKRPAQNFNLIKTKYGLNHAVSDDHRLLLFSNVGRGATGFKTQTVMTGKEFVEKQISREKGVRKRFKTTPESVITGTALPFTDEELRVIVMTAADSAYQDGAASCFVKFRKERKWNRAQRILEEAGVEIVSSSSKIDEEGKSNYHIRYRPVTGVKRIDQLWGASSDQLKVIAEEIIFWDGNEDDHVFFTKKKEEADFAQFAMIAAGKRAVMRGDSAARGDHENKGGTDYRVFGTNKTYISMLGTPKTLPTVIPSPDGFEYCFKVSTSFFLVRRGGVTVITGNCGMMAVRTSLKAEDLPDNLLALRTNLEKAIPHGRTDNGGPNDRGAWSDPRPTAVMTYATAEANKVSLHKRLQDICEKHPTINKNGAASRAINHLGTLGGGNHFVEVCLDTEDNVWIMLHSGSRGIGNRIGTYFISLAKEDMKKWFVNLPDQDLAYFPQGTQYYNDYLEAMHWAQDFALMNRRIMMKAALTALSSSVPKPFVMVDEAIESHHNYAEFEQHFNQRVLLTRKGAVSLGQGRLGIIPGSMGAKSHIVRAKPGKALAESYHSCSHGAGRAMSREKAKRTFTLEDHALATLGVECKKDASVLDETPGAYKDIDDVMTAQADHVDIVYTLKQVACIKG